MATQKKNKSFLKKLSSKYRFAIFNEQTYEELFVVRLSRLNVFTIVGSFGIVLIILVSILISFTGLREYIPGYPDANERLLIVRNAQRVDSLLVEIEKRDKFINNFQAVIRGEMPETAEDIKNRTAAAKNNSSNREIEFPRSEQDSLFRMQIEREERFNLSVRETPQRDIALESAFFVSPIKGIVVNTFGETSGHYGVDIVASPGSRVSSVMVGTGFFKKNVTFEIHRGQGEVNADGKTITTSWPTKIGFNVSKKHIKAAKKGWTKYKNGGWVSVNVLWDYNWKKGKTEQGLVLVCTSGSDKKETVTVSVSANEKGDISATIKEETKLEVKGKVVGNATIDRDGFLKMNKSHYEMRGAWAVHSVHGDVKFTMPHSLN